MQRASELTIVNKPLWVIIGLMIMASWVGNIWYYQAMQLEKPILLKHYMEINGYQSDWIELSYLENNTGDRRITGVLLEELPMLRLTVPPQPNTYYKHQVLKKAYGEWRKDDLGEMEPVPITIREATVFYNDGPSEKVPIGEINVVWEKEEGLLQSSSSGSSSDGTGHYSVTVQQPVILEQVDVSFSDRLGSSLELSMTGKDADDPHPQLPMSLNTGDPLTFNYKWSLPEELPGASEVYKASILLTFQTEDGRTVHERIPLSFNHYLDEKQIKELVRLGGDPS
ncbi:hypothetical protein [Paenibacillus sp. PL2-23]|uniref:hypothetical protein n=1 Tax=Paenibacillus sp. PL2-23 TaxID=2100729 RepID=UPI0030F75567